MQTFAKDFISLLQFLLPGFIAAWVFYSFTSHPKPSQFERVIQALIFTLFVQSFVFTIKQGMLLICKYLTIFNWTKESTIVWSVICAIFIGFIFSYFSNNDKFHKVIRFLKITKETSYPSEWFGAFQKNITYLVLHLVDERRVLGWPVEWPSEPQIGHFLLQDPSWLDGENEIVISGVQEILIDAKNVLWVEFMEKNQETQNG